MNVTDFETKYRDLVAGLAALHGVTHWCFDSDGQDVVFEPGTEWWPCPTRALLASSPAEAAQASSWDDRINDELRRTGKATETIRAMIEANAAAASSPAEREGEPVHGAIARGEALAAGQPDWMNVTTWPTPAPVSSGEAGGITPGGMPVCHECDRWGSHAPWCSQSKPSHVTPAPVVTPSPETEHDDRCESEFVPEAGAWTPCACGSRITPSTEGAETDG